MCETWTCYWKVSRDEIGPVLSEEINNIKWFDTERPVCSIMFCKGKQEELPRLLEST